MKTHHTAQSGVGGGAAAWEVPGQETRDSRAMWGLCQLPRQNWASARKEETMTMSWPLPHGSGKNPKPQWSGMSWADLLTLH